MTSAGGPRFRIAARLILRRVRVESGMAPGCRMPAKKLVGMLNRLLPNFK
jgi:hypothetical protein